MKTYSVLRIMVVNNKGDFIDLLEDVMLPNTTENKYLLKQYADDINFKNSSKSEPFDKHYIVIQQESSSAFANILVRCESAEDIMKKYIHEMISKINKSIEKG